MHYEELVKFMDFLMSAALQKCGNIQEAEELTQDTLLAALVCLSRGKTIENLQGWLLTVLNRRFYDMVRRKYRQPFISIGSDFDMADDEDAIAKIVAADEAEAVRREVAYLGRIYREVIVRHYMDGESIAGIAGALKLSEGTVKRRLYTGRNQIRKGIDEMENYTKQSYEPVSLFVGNNGAPGINGEPAALVYNDLVAQNLLWLAYEKPVTMEELSRAIGIPAAYVEPVIERLVNGELMRKTGNKYYTDFIIFTLEDKEKYLSAQKQLVQENFELFWKRIGEGLDRLREDTVYQRFRFDQRNSLEMYFTYRCIERGVYTFFDSTSHDKIIYPSRPNGGEWIAIGWVGQKSDSLKGRSELDAHKWSGERHTRFENYGGSRRIELHVYGPEGFPAPSYAHCFDDIPLLRRDERTDAVILKLLYIAYTGMNPSQVGFNTEALKAVPWLVNCRVLRLEDNKPTVNIPVLSTEEIRGLWLSCSQTADVMKNELKALLADYLKGKQQIIPPHLDSVPLQKRYFWAMNAFMLAIIREAIKRGKLYDGDYDNDSGANPPPCPMVLVIDKE